MNNEYVGELTNYLPITEYQETFFLRSGGMRATTDNHKLPEVLFITSYPPRECGIATYSRDLIKALYTKFHQAFSVTVCALESDNEKHDYPGEVKYIFNVDMPDDFKRVARAINENANIEVIVLEHEFGFFSQKEANLRLFLETLVKPIITVFHTVLPGPDAYLMARVQQISFVSSSIVVMTHSSARILIKDYGIPSQKITAIPHGTHLVVPADKAALKIKYNLNSRKVLSTFGLLSSGKGIETTLNALPAIIAHHPDVMFLILGKTHPSVLKNEGEVYRDKLKSIVRERALEEHVLFINYFLELPELLEYLQLTDIYLFTSTDPNQAVSGTFSYALASGCPIVSTPIPHALEVLQKDAGIIIDFEDSFQLSLAVLQLFDNVELRRDISTNALKRMASTAWENVAVSHAHLIGQIAGDFVPIRYSTPPLNLHHIEKLTTDFGMIQFSQGDEPDIHSGYTLDDNARAMIALCQQVELTHDEHYVKYIRIYFEFIKFCLQPEGYFLNYVDDQQVFTDQNNETNLADANGRAIWALGYLISLRHLLPEDLVLEAESVMHKGLQNITKIHSTRAMAFAIKGMYYRYTVIPASTDAEMVRELANRLVQMYRHEASEEWVWFESYLTYGNSVLPEAMLCAWLVTGESVYKEIASATFDFLISTTFRNNRISVVTNGTWLRRGQDAAQFSNGAEQPIDVAYAVVAFAKFHKVFRDKGYLEMMRTAFSWFLGNNHLHQIMYNPCSGGCYDGLEDSEVNLNQGAESTISYLMAALTMEKAMIDDLAMVQPMNMVAHGMPTRLLRATS